MRIRCAVIQILFLAVISLSGCSKGGGGDTPPPPPQATTLSGMVSKGPIKSATVKVFDVNFGTVDTSAPLGQGQTDDNGNFSIDIGPHQGPAVVEVTAGSFTDEVSGASISLKVALHTIVPDVPGGSITTVAATPLTELAFRQAKGSGDLTADSITKANASIASTFGIKDIVATLPTANGAADDQKKYAAVCGAFSQLVNDNRKLGESLDDALTRLITQMGDAEEHSGKLSTDSTVLLNTAMTEFSNSAQNTSGAALTTLSMPSSGVLKLTTVGTQYAMFGIDMILVLPTGVIVDADPLTGETSAGVVTISGVAATGTNNLLAAKYTPASVGAPGTVHIVFLNPVGFPLGEFATIQFTTTTGATFPLSNQFQALNFLAKGFNGAGLSGVTASPLSVEGI